MAMMLLMLHLQIFLPYVQNTVRAIVKKAEIYPTIGQCISVALWPDPGPGFGPSLPQFRVVPHLLKVQQGTNTNATIHGCCTEFNLAESSQKYMNIPPFL